MTLPYERQIEGLRKAQAASAARHLRRVGRGIRCQVRVALKNRIKTPDRYKAVFGCTYAELASHVERQFLPGMGWHNMGDWHIDHIIPVICFLKSGNSFDCNHYTNLRPLWAKDNLSKGSKT